MKERIRREYARQRAAEEDLVALRKQQKLRLKSAAPKTTALVKIRLLQQLCGIAMKSSWVFVMELFGWRNFQKRREVAGALGLTPMPYQSGDSAHDQGISRSGNRRVRAMAIEIAWSWLRYPATKPAQSMVPATIWGCRRADATDRHRGAGKTIDGGSVALCGIRDRARRGTDENFGNGSQRVNRSALAR
jgi:transposase